MECEPETNSSCTAGCVRQLRMSARARCPAPGVGCPGAHVLPSGRLAVGSAAGAAVIARPVWHCALDDCRGDRAHGQTPGVDPHPPPARAVAPFRRFWGPAAEQTTERALRFFAVPAIHDGAVSSLLQRSE